jgi:PAS domain S-box-containing protein
MKGTTRHKSSRIKPRRQSRVFGKGNRDVEKQLTLILNTVPQSIFWKDSNSVYLGCNAVFAKAAGLNSPDEIIGKTDYDLPWPRAEAEAYRADDREVIESNKSKSHIIEQMQQADGSRLWVDTTKIPLTDDTGRVVGVVGVYEDITGLKQAEAALRHSKALLHSVTEGTSDVVYVKDLKGRYLMLNAAASRFVGKPTEEVLGKDDTALLPPDEAREVMEGDRGVMESNTAQTYEETITLSDMPRTFLSTKGPVRDAQDKVVGLFGIARDITERKRVEEVLRESETRFRLLVQNSNDIILMLDAEGIIRFISPAIERIAGYHPRELEGTVALAHIHPDDQHKVYSIFASNIGNIGVTARLEYRYRHKNGDWLNFEANAVNRLQTPQFHSILVNIRDITERKQAEESLQESEERFSAVVRQAKDGILLIQDNFLIFVNQALADMLGYNPKEMENTPFLNYIAPESREMVAERVESRLRGNNPPSIYEAKLLRRDGGIVDAELSAGIIQHRGKPTDVGLIRDITERKRAEEALLESQRKLKDIVDFLPDATLVIDKEGRVLAWNRAIEIMTGIKADDMLGKGNYEYAIPFYSERRPILIDLALLADKDIETRYTTIQRVGDILFGEAFSPSLPGGNLYLSATACVLRNNKSNIVGAIECIRDNTVRKRTEEALREREEFLSSIIENIPDMIFIKDAKELKFIRFNKAGELLLGYKREDLLGKNDYDFFPKEQADFFTKNDRGVLESGQLCDIPEEPIETKTGRRILHTKKIPILDKNGHPAYLLGISEDITKRKQAEDILRRYELLAEQSRDIILFLRRDNGRILEANSAATTSYGYSRQELLDLSIQDLRAPETLDLTAELMAKADTEGILFETFHRRKDGSTFPVEVSSRGATVNNIRTLVSVIRDITERKRAHDVLRENEEKMRSIFRAAPIGIGVVVNRVFTEVNQRLCEMIGYTAMNSSVDRPE